MAFQHGVPPQPSPPPFRESEMTFVWIKSKRIKGRRDLRNVGWGEKRVHPPLNVAWVSMSPPAWRPCTVFEHVMHLHQNKTNENTPLGNGRKCVTRAVYNHILVVNVKPESFICFTRGDNISDSYLSYITHKPDPYVTRCTNTESICLSKRSVHHITRITLI